MKPHSQLESLPVPTPLDKDVRFLRAVLTASDDCIKVISLDGALEFMSEGGQRVMEVQDFEAIRGSPWLQFWDGAGNADAQAALAAARAGKSYRFQGPASTAAGNMRYWDVQVSPIIASDGKPEAILSVSRDITALRAGEERYQLLAAELNHRIKNLLAMVSGIVNQSLRGQDEPLDAVKRRLSDRLQALAAAQDVLMMASRHGADLRQLVEVVLAPHRSGERIAFDGPSVTLSSKCALAMALALHELGTNAVKYGALSQDGGHVDVSWRNEGGEFHFRWQESGGPRVTAPQRRGFGSQMIEKVLGGYLGGTARIDFAPDGIVLALDTTTAALAEG
ncbi:HWE histidine kinase domain-containing protein [Bosea vestrisii]|uniref:HWE histidine kinase domain-containing protein n=1 Tax=Bosea vestrisii TaxID=151416 RepID=UPI0024DFB452|nr:HWE histidine kinase domain-containing protein [Bosea vestrisii]WID94750.1 HWE histidine kinase domain-containing protein [Bosea vestrisii]